MFYQRFSKIVSPLTQKEELFHCSPTCEQAFTKLKDKLTSILILIILVRGVLFVVYTDASLLGLGGVLIQKERVVAYASRQLWMHKVNYPRHDGIGDNLLCFEGLAKLYV